MSLETEIAADFLQLLDEHGTAATFGTVTVTVLASRARAEQQVDVGGFVESPDLSVRALKSAFTGALPTFGERVGMEGTDYRITKVSTHPRSPLLTLYLTGENE